MPFREGEEAKRSASGGLSECPWAPDAARNLDGSIRSVGCPINPKTIEEFTELHKGDDRAAWGVHLGDITEIGLRLGSSENPERHSLAADLFRSSTGYQDGSNGKFGATRNGQVLDQTMQVLVSVGLATAFYAASAQLKALGLPERAREKYLERALNPSMMAYAAISRSSHVGAPLGVANFISAPLEFDQAAMLRTSILPREKREQQAGRAIKYNPLQTDLISGFIGGVAEQIPAANVAAHGVQAGYSVINLMGDQPRADKQGHMTGLWNALRQFVPNDPLSQSLMQRLAEDQGVDRAR